MASIKKTFFYYIIRLVRIILDVSTNIFFGLIYGKPKDIPPITNRILMQPAVELAKKIRKKQLKSVDVVKAYIERIKEVQPIINAIVDERYEDALKEAKAVDDLIQSGTKTEEQIAKDTPFLGVPFSCKEAIGVKGFSWTSGIVSRKGIKADTDADVVIAMREAGAIPLVSTNVCEYCMWWNSSNHLYGITRNPYDTRRIPGGSSGGEGALLGAGGTVFGLGSDIGGSIRNPAFFNCVFGHKPTKRIVSCTGQFPSDENELAEYGVIGPMCRYASDLLPMMKILTKHPSLRLDSQVDLAKLKIYYMEDEGGHPFQTPVVPEIRASMRRALKHFEETYDIQPQEVAFPEMKHAFCIWFTMMCTANASSLAEEMADRQGKANLKLEFLKFCFRCCDHTAPALFVAFLETVVFDPDSEKTSKYLGMLETLRTKFEEILKDDCVFFFPTQPEPAPYLLQTIPKTFNIGYNGIFNMLGFPSTQAPLGFSQGLPIGIQVVGALYNDHLTIAVAEELGRAFGGWISPTMVKTKSQYAAGEATAEKHQ